MMVRHQQKHASNRIFGNKWFSEETHSLRISEQEHSPKIHSYLFPNIGDKLDYFYRVVSDIISIFGKVSLAAVSADQTIPVS